MLQCKRTQGPSLYECLLILVTKYAIHDMVTGHGLIVMMIQQTPSIYNYIAFSQRLCKGKHQILDLHHITT